jgi:hypothetical protein
MHNLSSPYFPHILLKLVRFLPETLHFTKLESSPYFPHILLKLVRFSPKTLDFTRLESSPYFPHILRKLSQNTAQPLILRWFESAPYLPHICKSVNVGDINTHDYFMKKGHMNNYKELSKRFTKTKNHEMQ